ncbi:unnamed protein product [Lampetra planeri]
MEEKADDPIAVKVEEHSQCVILTYFHGDIGSMVDAHFSRALSKVCRAQGSSTGQEKARGCRRLHTLCPKKGLSVTGEQCATSLLNLLHSDRTEMGPSMASSSKPELLPSWMVPQGFRDSVDLTGGFETGRRLDKKDLYWY